MQTGIIETVELINNIPETQFSLCNRLSVKKSVAESIIRVTPVNQTKKYYTSLLF